MNRKQMRMVEEHARETVALLERTRKERGHLTVAEKELYDSALSLLRACWFSRNWIWVVIAAAFCFWGAFELLGHFL